MSNDEDFVDIEDIQINNEHEIENTYNTHKSKLAGKDTRQFLLHEVYKTVKSLGTQYKNRILTDEDRQVGFIMLDLNKAGDIDSKYCSYYNEEGTHNITHSVDYSFDQETKKMVKDKERLSFTSITRIIAISSLIHECQNHYAGM